MTFYDIVHKFLIKALCDAGEILYVNEKDSYVRWYLVLRQLVRVLLCKLSDRRRHKLGKVRFYLLENLYAQ